MSKRRQINVYLHPDLDDWWEQMPPLLKSHTVNEAIRCYRLLGDGVDPLLLSSRLDRTDAKLEEQEEEIALLRPLLIHHDEKIRELFALKEVMDRIAVHYSSIPDPEEEP